MSKLKTRSNNLGAISALKGYRLQFLYSLDRILAFKEFETKFRPEGEFEDLDIYNHVNTVIEIIQIKDLGDTLTLADLTTSKKDNTFLKRAIKAYGDGNRPSIRLVSFGEINEDVKNLSNSNYSESFIKKLYKQGLTKGDIEILKGNFKYEIVDEQQIKNNILSNIEKWGSFADAQITIDLLIYWIYYAAEKQFSITPTDFKDQFEKICKFQSERVSFNKTYNSLIRSLDNDLEQDDVEHLKLDFYKGISATYKHILADVDVVRADKLNLIQEKFKESNIVFIHGASGQGKSTLAFRYLNENCVGTTVLELKQLPENIETIYDVINSLEGISKGIRFPITIYIDVEPGNKEWISILRELATKKNFNFLVTIREEDWNSIEVGDKFIFSEIELIFEHKEAELIYNALDNYNKDLKFINFENAWENFGGQGPLLEFTYLITQNESLSDKLKSQINKIRGDSSDLGKEKVRLLRYIVLADSYGSKVKLKELNEFLEPKNEILLLIELLQKEYLLKISGDKSHITGLHPVRSVIIKKILFDNEINKESDFALDSLSFISDNTVQVFLQTAFRYSDLLPERLIEHLKEFEPKSWQMYFLIFKSLLWKGIADYAEKNINELNSIYSDYGKGWITVVNFDFTGIISGGSLMENADFFTEEQRQYAKSMNQKLSSKDEVFSYCLNWLNNLKAITITPQGKDEWTSFGIFLFWLNHFNIKSVVIDFNRFEFEKNLILQPLEAIAYTTYALKKYSKQTFGYVKKTEKLFLQKLSEKYSIISIEQKGKDISCHYLFDIVDEKFETEESDLMNAKSMRIIDLLRIAFPDKEHYNSNGVGHKFSFSPDNYDSSIKHIPQKNIPFNPLVEINSIYFNLFNFSKRPNNWAEYVGLIINRRLLFNQVLNNLIQSFKASHIQNNLDSLRTYILYYVEKQNELKKLINPLLPKNVTDEWGEFGENGIKQNNNTNLALSFQQYKVFEKALNDYNTSIENFLNQSANVIISKIKSINNQSEFDSDTARVSLVGNLFKAFEFVDNFQKEFKVRFQKFVDPLVLNRIENTETENITILCFLYRQFIYSDSFIVGNACKIAITRLKDTDLNIKNKISNGLKILARENNTNIKVDFDEKNNRCVIILNHNNSMATLQLIEQLYNKLYELLEQPDYTSIKYLILNTKYPIFKIILLVSGKSIKSNCYEFQTYNLREKRFDELKQFNLMAKEIPSDIIEKHSIEIWNNESIEFGNLDKLLESISTAYHLAFHLSQLGYFKNKTVEDYSKTILKNHVDKIGRLFEMNLQKGLDIFDIYNEQCNYSGIEFTDEIEQQEFRDFLVDSLKLFYPNEKLFKKGELSISLSSKELEERIPRLEKLVKNIWVIYYFLAGKIIEKEIKRIDN